MGNDNDSPNRIPSWKFSDEKHEFNIIIVTLGENYHSSLFIKVPVCYQGTMQALAVGIFVHSNNYQSLVVLL